MIVVNKPDKWDLMRGKVRGSKWLQVILSTQKVLRSLNGFKFRFHDEVLDYYSCILSCLLSVLKL